MLLFVLRLDKQSFTNFKTKAAMFGRNSILERTPMALVEEAAISTQDSSKQEGL
jgi:hypothetical protein